MTHHLKESESGPRRVQLSRAKGWRMPPNTVKVDRSTKWGNPFVPGKENPFIPGRVVEDRRHALKLYQSFAPQATKLVEAARDDLAGKNLACWCGRSSDPYEKYFCHADVLLELANPKSSTSSPVPHDAAGERAPELTSTSHSSGATPPASSEGGGA